MFGGLKNVYQAGNRALHPYSNRLLLTGMGLLSGRNGMADAMKGLVAGSALDTEDADRTKLNKALQALMDDPKALSNLSPGERNFALNDAPTARLAVAQQLRPDDVGETYKNYQRAVADGSFQGGFYEYQQGLKAAGNTFQVGGQEKAYDKTVGEGFGKDYLTIQQGARDASSTIGKLDRLGTALSTPGVYTGAGGEFVADLKKAAAGLGIPVEGVAETDVARAISNEITLQLRNPAGGAGLPGAMSDADRQFLATIPPGLTNTPEGNRQKLDMLKKVQQRNIDVAREANKYAQANGQLDAGFYQQLADWAETHPLFPEGDTPAELQSLKQKYGLE
jgi:hypothetical protein